MDKPVVVISSTGEDLRDYRRIVVDLCAELGMDSEYQEREISDGQSTGASASLSLVERATWYVGVIAWRYGKSVPGTNKSFTELEYERARERKLPLYIFMLDDRASWPLDLVDDNRSSIKGFRSRIREQDNQFCHLFTDKSAFRDAVLKVLSGAKTKWEIKRIVEAATKVGGIRQRTIGILMSGPVSSTIIKIAALKSMHDALHGILQNCVNPLFDQVLGPLGDAEKVAEDGVLIESRRAFDAGRVDLVAGRGAGQNRVIDQCIQRLNLLANDWDNFQTSRQRRELEAIARKIEDAVQQPFTYMNVQLLAESSELDRALPPVVDVLREALTLARSDASDVNVKLIESRIKQLQETRELLQHSITEHDCWQDVHDILHHIATRSGMTPAYHEAIVNFWDANSTLCHRLAEQHDDVLSKSLRLACVVLDTRRNSDSTETQLLESFGTFCQCFDRAFYHVDWTLNQLCQSLAERAQEVLKVLNTLADEMARKFEQ